MNGGAEPAAYVTGSVTSRDGTVIGYRQLGRGPGLIAVHAGMQAAQNLMKLAGALAGSFTVALQAALVLPAVSQAALYEPPLSVNGSTPTGWVARYDREVAQGRLASAAITAVRGLEMAPPVLRFVPRIAGTPHRAARAGVAAAEGRGT